MVFNLPAALQRAIPDYTHSLQDKLGSNQQVQRQLGGIVNDQNKELSNCANASEQLQNCGPAPDLKGIVAWLNTPGDKPIDLHSLRGKVVLVDFWAYSCINCQRAIPHVAGWYKAYQDSGFEVIGVHTPEYAFEKVTSNVRKGAADLGITYPIAQDNNYSTWTNYRNEFWPAEYLIDANGTVRHIKFGEGDYNGTEKLIRELIADAHKGVALPPPVDAPDTTPQNGLTPETYFGVGKVVNFAGGGTYDEGRADFVFPAALPDDSFALQGPWTLNYQGATADSGASSIELNYHAKNVYVVVGRYRQSDRDARRHDDNAAGRRAAAGTADRRRRRGDPRVASGPSRPRAAGVLLHVRLIANPSPVRLRMTHMNMHSKLIPATGLAATAVGLVLANSAPAGAAPNLIGAGCADYAAQHSAGPASVTGMSQVPVAVAASNNPELTTLTAALSGQLNPQVNLVDTLNSGQFTVFAPTDAAFNKLPADTINQLKTNPDMLKSILTYHVVPGQLSPNQVDGSHNSVRGCTGERDRVRQRPQSQQRRLGLWRSAYHQCAGVHDRHGADAPRPVSLAAAPERRWPGEDFR